MRRSLLGLLVAGMAVFALAAPTPANAAVWCGWYWTGVRATGCGRLATGGATGCGRGARLYL
jgi:hypothetical protein